MTIIDSPVARTAGVAPLQWGPVIAGAIAAAALAFVLHSFALGLGLSLTSTAPTWRDASFALIFLTGLYLVLVAIVSYAFGGYVAARLRTPIGGAAEDIEFRDGMHGLMVWALATLITGVLAFGTVAALQRLAAPGGSTTNASSSVAGENIIAYDLDRLFRTDRPRQADLTYPRSEAARILLTASSHTGVSSDDRAYLARLVGAYAGLAGPDADRRVDDVIARARQNIDRARHAAVLIGFMAGAAALLGAAAAWYAAVAAARHREGIAALSPFWDWGRNPYAHPRM
jgi:hypothetical protein